MHKILELTDKTFEYLTEMPLVHQVIVGALMLVISYGLLLYIIYKPLL